MAQTRRRYGTEDADGFWAKDATCRRSAGRSARATSGAKTPQTLTMPELPKEGFKVVVDNSDPATIF
jgi:hypothetical protein